MIRERTQMAISLFVIVLFVALALFLASCTTTFRQALVTMHKGAVVLEAADVPLQAKCLERARACEGKVKTVEDCKPYVACRDVQRSIAEGLAAAQAAIARLERARKAAVAAGVMKEE